MEDLGFDDFDDFDSLPIKPRGKAVSPVKLPSSLEAKSPSAKLEKSPIKGQSPNSGRVDDSNDRTALLAASGTV